MAVKHFGVTPEEGASIHDEWERATDIPRDMPEILKQTAAEISFGVYVQKYQLMITGLRLLEEGKVSDDKKEFIVPIGVAQVLFDEAHECCGWFIKYLDLDK